VRGWQCKDLETEKSLKRDLNPVYNALLKLELGQRGASGPRRTPLARAAVVACREAAPESGTASRHATNISGQWFLLVSGLSTKDDDSDVLAMHSLIESAMPFPDEIHRMSNSGYRAISEDQNRGVV